ncbi:hypothetical protein C8Q79DRAFT_456806 [Trametes meyenii]|nr:hypothetical protein C8Q79DRAFT_456806 [Trametes meyenii]
MRPYLRPVLELRAGPGYRPGLLNVACSAALLNPQILLNLRTISFVEINFARHTRIHAAIFLALTALTSVTELLLSDCVFYDLKHILSLICSFPQLSTLSLDRISYEWTHRQPALPYPLALGSAGVMKSRLSVLYINSLSNTPRASIEVAQWLADGPTGASLTSLIIPHHVQHSDKLYRLFGPSVKHLKTPLGHLSSHAGYLCLWR